MKSLIERVFLTGVALAAGGAGFFPALASNYTGRPYNDYQPSYYGNSYNQGYAPAYAPAYAGPPPAYSTAPPIYSGPPRRYYRDQSGTEQVGKGAVGFGDRSAKVGVGVGAKAAKEAFKAVF